jgi:hypothetical protein
MEALAAKELAAQWLMAHSRFEPDRKYLGMSGIGKCPLRLYRECMQGRRFEMNLVSARRAYRGYLFERDAHERLAQAGVYQAESAGKEIVCDFDARFIGHTDGETLDGDLLEIKSVNNEDYERIVHSHHALPEHYDQVQMYLRYGHYAHGLLYYIDTETFRDFMLDVFPDERRQELLARRAHSILDAIDGLANAPACTCGRCFVAKGGANDQP